MSWQCNLPTKKAFRTKVEQRQRDAKQPTHITDHCFNPGMFPEKETGRVAVEGPYPVHKWYATVELDEKGYILKVS